MLPALPPCPSLLAAALAPVVMILPTTRFPALPVPVVVSVTTPDVATLDELRVSIVVLLASMLGAVMVMIPIIWGVLQKARAEALAKERETIAVQAGVHAGNIGAVNSPTEIVSPAHAQDLIKEFVK